MKELKQLLGLLSTETGNPKSENLDQMSTEEILRLMNQEDENVIKTVNEAIPEIKIVVEKVVQAIESGGRLIYMGAGTSGRIGVMDAVECVPTFSTTDEVIAVMAGGESAFVSAKEGSEDSEEEAYTDLEMLNLKKGDVVLALAASGRTPYAIGALKAAREKGAMCVSLACNKNAIISPYADIAIEVDAGPEVLTGSTRLKAGTCQKLILNMISTAAMVGLGKVYKHYMVDMKATNQKLEDRAKRIVMSVTDCSEDEAIRALREADKSIKAAIVMILTKMTKAEAEEELRVNKGFVRACV